MKLFYKLLIVFLLTALGPILFLGTRLLQETQRSLREASLGLQRGLADRAAEDVRHYLEDLRSVLTVTARSAAFLPAGSPDRRALLGSVLNNYPMFVDISLHDDAGRKVYSLSRFPRADPAPDALPALAHGALEEAGYFVGAVEKTPDGHGVMTVSVLFEGRSGERAGDLTARVTLLDLDAKLLGLDLGDGGLAYVVDGAGRLVAHSSPDENFEGSFKAPPGLTGPDWRQGEYRGPGGDLVLGVKAQVPGVGWSLLLERPSAAAYRLVAKVRRRVRVALFLAIVLSVGLSLALTPALVRPLREFEAAVRKMRGGEFDAVITARSNDEIGSVAQALREAQKAMEKKVRQATVGLMAHRIGHDMRQPLTAVRNSLEVIRRHVSGVDAVARKHFELVDDELRRGGEYVEEILTLGRERPTKLEPADLNGLVREAVSKVPPRDGVEIVMDLEQDLPACSVDKSQVHRALANLLSNAREAIAEKGAVRVSTRAAGGRVSVAVADDGAGIPEEDRERVFEEFFTTKPGGTGLGMGIVKRIAEMHNGSLTLESRPGRGTSVVISFPVR